MRLGLKMPGQAPDYQMRCDFLALIWTREMIATAWHGLNCSPILHGETRILHGETRILHGETRILHGETRILHD